MKQYQGMKSLEEEPDALLRSISIHWGFCSIPPEGWLRITQSKRLDAREFSVAVLLAEGFEEAETNIEWMRRLERRFIEHFGSALVFEGQFSGDTPSPATRT